jgi:predicted phosphodiesterase
MGLQFDLETANWLSFVIEPNAPIPPLETSEQFERLNAFLRAFSERFHSSSEREFNLENLIHGVLINISEAPNSKVIADAIDQIRKYFADRVWTAIIVPSGDDPNLDRYLCSSDFLQILLGPSRFPGLILQLAEPPKEKLVLNHIFPAFQIALLDSSAWPGLLVWNRRAQGTFFPFGSSSVDSIVERAQWIIDKLNGTRFPEMPNLFEVRELYKVAFPETRPKGTKLHILQISDIHLGSTEAGIRLSRVEQHIENLVNELRDGLVVPVVSGDLMDSPRDTNLDAVRVFFKFLSGLHVAPPLAVLGNHDVRKDGWLQRILGKALQIPTTHGVHWYDEAKVGIACFNSVVEGRLARGFIGERQRIDIANEIDGSTDRKDFAIVGVLHHHPMPVEMPDWITRPFYERFIGDSFDKTTVLEDADAFVQYAEAMEMAAVLHGHEHIPRIAETPNGKIPVFGCGSSVGKVKTKNINETCISINVITLDAEKQHLTGRVLAERVVGGGLAPFYRHAMIYRRRSNWVHKVLSI